METLILSTMVTVNVIAICWMVLWASRISTEIDELSNVCLETVGKCVLASLAMMEDTLKENEETSSCTENERSKDTGEVE